MMYSNHVSQITFLTQLYAIRFACTEGDILLSLPFFWRLSEASILQKTQRMVDVYHEERFFK